MSGRKRKHLIIGRRSGEVIMVTETVEGDVDFSTRVRELKEQLPAPGKHVTAFAHVVCDGCDARAEMDFSNPQLPPGWAACENGDFCPRCQVLN